jgi:tRNA(fMet)-specific endonuclease VapC
VVSQSPPAQYPGRTDHVSLLETGHLACTKRLNLVGYDQVATTTIIVEERLQGWLGAVRQASAPNQADRRLIWAYTGLRKTVQYVNGFVILDWTESASRKFFELRQEKVRIGTQDLRIAAIALSVAAVVVTRNQKDFSQVAGLQIEAWSGSSCHRRSTNISPRCINNINPTCTSLGMAAAL